MASISISVYGWKPMTELGFFGQNSFSFDTFLVKKYVLWVFKIDDTFSFKTQERGTHVRNKYESKRYEGKESKAWLNMAWNCKPNAVYFPYFDSRIYKGRHCFRTRCCEQERCLPDLISPQWQKSESRKSCRLGSKGQDRFGKLCVPLENS